jgi:hypothetical protein
MEQGLHWSEFEAHKIEHLMKTKIVLFLDIVFFVFVYVSFFFFVEFVNYCVDIWSIPISLQVRSYCF